MRKLIAFISKSGFNLTILYVALMTTLSGNAAGFVVSVINRTAEATVTGMYSIKEVLLFFLVLTGFLLTRWFAVRKTNYLSERVIEIYRLRVVHLIRQAELLSIEHIGESDLYVKLTKDATKVSQAFRRTLRGFESFVVSVFVFFYIIWQYSGAAILVAAFVGVSAVLYLIVYEILYPLIHDVTDQETELFDLFTHLLNGFKELKMDHGKNEDWFHHYLIPQAEIVRSQRIRLDSLYAQIETTSDFMYYLGMGAVLFLFPADIPAIVRFEVIGMLLFLWNHVYKLYEVIPHITAAEASIERLERLELQLQNASEPANYSCSYVIPVVPFQEFAVDNVTFHYTDHEGVPTYSIGPISLAIQPGKMLFIVGGNGSGKTTFIKVLTGLYAPAAGRFSIDGTEINIAEHRYLFSPIFSDFHLFDSLYGIEHVDEQQVRDLLHQMDIAQKTEWRDGRFTDIKLSTGQRKRLAMITAILEDKPIYVFDEWAAEQDPHFRAYFYEVLLPKFKAQGKALIIITHDERYFHLADRVVKMRDGKLLEGWSWQKTSEGE